MVALLWSHNSISLREFKNLCQGGQFCNRDTYEKDGYLLIYKNGRFIRVYD